MLRSAVSAARLGFATVRLAQANVRISVETRRGFVSSAPVLNTAAVKDTSGVSKATDRKAALILDDGSVYVGQSFGYEESIAGEVVFNTGMVGYVENLTDPSYKGQILTLTYPIVGNYGVPSGEPDALGLAAGMESDRVQVSGLLVANYCHQPSHWQSAQTLSEWLKKHEVPGMYGVDTRALTKKLREAGSMKGKIVLDTDVQLIDPNTRHLVKEVSRKEPQTFGDGDVKILALDCGMKNNIVRNFVRCGVTLKVVPFDWDISKEEYDGLFISNGPGDPAQCVETVKMLAEAIKGDIPIFGICLGNQLLARAAGCDTFKLPYGNRGHNQPVRDLLTNKLYITPQNHGFAVNHNNLPADWHPYFININDYTNEGIIHATKPIFSVQFHPEASGGPEDTSFLFDKFIASATEYKTHKTCQSLYTSRPYFRNKKILLLGSGGLQIGQAGEFDYSGAQAIKSLKEEGCEVILFNPNIATVQTSKGLADSVYFLPLTPHFIEQVIAREKPDALLLGFGGQTALNVGVELHDTGILAKHKVRVLGSPISTIIAAEDREIFKQKLDEIGEKLAESVSCLTVDECVAAGQKLGYPVMARAAFTLGGLGSGFSRDDAEMRELASKAFTTSPQLLIEKSVLGWKEVEYEVVRDAYDNCVTVCNMENFDPMGIHTGESIVVAPSQTLNNDEYHMLRTTAVNVVRHLGIIGECNIQYALDPNSLDYIIIEVNPRLSRSSALASKATGYPLAAVASKLSLGIELEMVPNAVTKCTTAAFEPSLDYIVVKFPKWDLSKFDRVATQIGSQMRSVGEVMAIGREFPETMQKAIRMVDPNHRGFQPKQVMTKEARDTELAVPTDQRVFAIADAFYNAGYSVDDVWAITKIDRWYLHQLKYLADLSVEIEGQTLKSIRQEQWAMYKKAGFSDLQIAERIGSTETEVRAQRKKRGVTPWVKQIDTLAAEFPAATNYLYMSYHGSEHDVEFADNGYMVLGCGTYRIGSSVEFDFGSVWCMRNLRQMGHKTIMLNNNPETVSTDFDESDRLYFDELSTERAMDVHDLETPIGCFVSFGGQIPNNLCNKLAAHGVEIVGTSPLSIDTAEDRHKHSAMLDEIAVDQPEWAELTTLEAAESFAERVGYPVLIRPSYVLSGAAMNVVKTKAELDYFLTMASDLSPDHPVVMSKYMGDANEIDVDAVAQDGRVIAIAISEHIEKGGVHSGDATLVLPSRDMAQSVWDGCKETAEKIANRLKITGPFNMQILEKDGVLKVIETNVRASRSLPFSAKVLGVDFVGLATRAMVGSEQLEFQERCARQREMKYQAVKVPQFSWKRLPGADPLLGVEMASTGEIACFHTDKYGSYLRGLQATHFKLPAPNTNILVSVPEDIDASSPAAQGLKKFVDMGYELRGIPKHVAALKNIGIAAVHAADDVNGAQEIRNYDVSMCIDVLNSREDHWYEMRRDTVDFNVPLVVNEQQVLVLATALEMYRNDPGVCPWNSFNDETHHIESFDQVTHVF